MNNQAARKVRRVFPSKSVARKFRKAMKLYKRTPTFKRANPKVPGTFKNRKR